MAAQFKKKIKPGLIELDPVEPVIILHFLTQTVDTTTEGPDGKPLVVESLSDSKRFRLSKFHTGSNATKFAEALVKSSNLFHESKVPLITNLLEELRQRLIEQGGGGGGDDALSATTPLPLAKAASVPGGAHGPSSGGGGGGGDAGFDLRASAPAMPSKARVGGGSAISVRHSVDEREEDEAGGSASRGGGGDDEPDMAARRSTVRPGSAARSRTNGGGAAPSAIDTRGGDLHSPAPSMSPTMSGGGNGNGGGGNNSKSSQGKQQQQQVHSPPPPPPLTEAEEEQLELERQMKRERDERMVRDARKLRNAKRSEAALVAAARAEQDRLVQVERREVLRKKREKEKTKKQESASLKRLDEYIESLYEEDAALKIRGTGLILQLVQNPENLDHFIDNDTVLGALARVLKDDYKKSTELVTNILEIFFCFSSFRQLHPILIANKIGETTIKVIDLEIKRYEIRREKEERARLDGGGAPIPGNNPQGDISTHYATPGARESAEERERVKKLTAFLQAQEKLLFVCFYILLNLAEDFQIEMRMKAKKLLRYLLAVLHRTGCPHADDRGFLDELHLLVLTFLKKLSIFDENKKEMKEYNIIQTIQIFMNNHAPVASTVTNLSDSNSMQSLPSPAVSAPNPEILEAVLRLLYNLSFDSELKKEIALSGGAGGTGGAAAGGGIGGGWVIPKNFGKPNQAHLPPNSHMPGSPSHAQSTATAASGQSQQLMQLGGQLFHPDRDLNSLNLIVRMVEFLRRPSLNVRLVSARVLYNLSSDLNFRPLVDRTLLPDLSLLSSLLLRCPNKLVDKEVVALAINASWSPEVVEAILSPEVLYALIKRVHQTFDPLLAKFLRNISAQGAHQGLFKKFLHELVGMTLKSPSHDFLLEALAILANIALPDVLYSELIAQHGLLDFLLTHLQPGFADDDIVLESVQLLGTLALDPRSAPMLAHGHLIRSLTQLLTDKIEDLDLVVHIVFTLFKFLLHRETREAIMLHQHLTDCLLDLVVDPSPEVRHLANMCLDIIMEHDDLWRDKIRAKRFEAFNREWLQLIANSSGGGMGHLGDQMGGGMMSGGGGGGLPYGDSMGDSMDDSREESAMARQAGGMGAYSYPGHDPMGELGESGGIEHYRHEQSREHESLEDSEDLSQR